MCGWPRRAFLLACAALVAPAQAQDSGEDVVGAPLAPWRPGKLDIHHIATGRGDSALIVAPDGTTLLIDAGAATGERRFLLPARPDDSERPGEWIARYIERRLADTRRLRIDDALITHLHPDHFGAIADIDALIGIERLVDPDYPHYDAAHFETRRACEAYVAYVRERAQRGGCVERFAVGRADQFRLRYGPRADFDIRNLAARGRVWTGEANETRDAFAQRAASDHPNENAGSAALRLRYGAFDYFAAGDLTDWADAGAAPWMDALTPAAQAAGRVEAAVAPHHGLYDASGAAMTRALAARVWVIQAWHASHPSAPTLDRLMNPRLYEGPRDVYATGLSDAADIVGARLTQRLASRDGHVILRVEAGGRTFRVVVADNRDSVDRVLSVSPPLACA